MTNMLVIIIFINNVLVINSFMTYMLVILIFMNNVLIISFLTF